MYIITKSDIFNTNFRSKFEYKNHIFISIDHAFQYEKAIIFEDKTAAYLISKESNRHKIRALSQKIKDFDPEKWNKIREKIMENIIYCRLVQDTTLLTYATINKGKTFICHNKNDSYWGIGNDKNGENMIGKLWTSICE